MVQINFLLSISSLDDFAEDVFFKSAKFLSHSARWLELIEKDGDYFTNQNPSRAFVRKL